MLERKIHERLRDDRGYQAIQALDGVGRTIAAIFVTEIGDVTRFRSAEALCSWAGLTPRHRESDTKVTRGRITKQGSKLVRWAALEAVVRYHGGDRLRDDFHRDRGAARQEQSPRRGGPQTPHARLLRPARRRDPLPARQRSRRGVRARTRPRASSPIGMTPTLVASRRK